MIHELPLERRTLHGHFSPDREPVLAVDPGDSVVFPTLDVGWGIGPPTDDRGTRERLSPRDPDLDSGHALVGPIEVRGARANGTLAVHFDELRVGAYGITDAGGFDNALNQRLGVAGGETHTLVWSLDPDAGTARDQHSRTVDLQPFLGVVGMPPPEPGVHSTLPPHAGAGTSTARSSSPGRPYTCRSRSTAGSSPPATRTRARATARSHSLRWSARWSERG